MDDGEVNLNLVQPTGVDRCVDLNRVSMPLRDPLLRYFSPVRRAVVGDPENPVSRTIGFLPHHQVHQAMVGLDSRRGPAQSEHLGPANVPRRHIGQRSATLVLELHPSEPPRGWSLSFRHPFAGLNAGLLVGADHVIIRPQSLAFPNPLVQVQHSTGLLGKPLVAGKNPTAIRPRADGVGIQPPPHRASADRSDDATPDRLSGDIGATEPRERQSRLARQFTRQSLDLDHHLGGEKDSGDPGADDSPIRPDAPRKTVSAIC